MSISYAPSPAELVKEQNTNTQLVNTTRRHWLPTALLKDDHSRALAVSNSQEANVALSNYKMPTTVYGDIVVSGRNAEVCNGDESTNHHSNTYSYIPLRNVNVGSEFKYIKVISGVVHNGETGVGNASKYDRIEIKAPDSGDAKALVKNGRFESVELQRSWFEEMRDLEERSKERERQRKREEESTRGRMRDLIPRRGRREGDLINSGRAMGLDFLE